MTQLKQDRFAAYNAAQKKNPPVTTEYPKMLTNPDDGATSIVNNEDEHRQLVGDKKFESQPLWGPSAKAAPDKATLPAQEQKLAEVIIPDNARMRKGLKAVSLDGSTADVGPQTIFENPPPTAA